MAGEDGEERARSADSTLRLDEVEPAQARERGARLLAAGQVVAGRYRVVRFVAAGGMAEVYAAHDQMLTVDVALKLLGPRYASSPVALERFRREIYLARRVTHPNVCRIYDVGVHQDGGREVMFLTMELLGGETLSARLRRAGPLSTAEALPLVVHMAQALAAAHRAGIIHRDFKSANVILEPSAHEPGGLRAVVTDFGVALPAGALEAPDLLPTTIEGTPAYMAPEQLAGGPPTPAADLYAFGVVMFEMLSGALPFRVDESLARAVGGERGPVPGLRTRVARLEARWETAILRCLEEDPRRRPASAAAVLAAVSPARSPRAVWGLAAVVSAALLASGALVLRGSGRHAPPISVSAVRRVTFDVGCEEFPSFTPDGRSLVFNASIDGDTELFALDLPSGARRRLTHTSGWDYKAAVSVDGAQLAYLHYGAGGRELRVLPIAGDGEGAMPSVLGPSITAPAWTAGGEVLAGTLSSEVARWRREGETWRREIAVQLPAGELVRSLAARSDGHLAALLHRPPDTQHSDLVDLAPDGAPNVLEADIPLASAALALSPGGEAVYYTHRSASAENELLRRPFGGGEAVTVPGGIAPQNGLAISADGRHLAYSDCRERSFLARVAPGRPPVELTPRRDWRDSLGAQLDRGRLVVRSSRSGSDRIYALDLASGDIHPLTGPGTVDPALSPDRRWLAYVDRSAGLRLLPLGGGEARALTDDPTDASPRFSADGSRIVFMRTSRLLVIPVDGGAPRALTPPGVRPVQLDVSPVGEGVVYLEVAEPHTRLMLTDLAGSFQAPVPGLPPGDYIDPRFSPDGQHVLVIANRTRLLEVTLDGSAAPALLWDAGQDGLYSAAYAPDGDGFLVTVSTWDGDIWLADGQFD